MDCELAAAPGMDFFAQRFSCAIACLSHNSAGSICHQALDKVNYIYVADIPGVARDVMARPHDEVWLNMTQPISKGLSKYQFWHYLPDHPRGICVGQVGLNQSCFQSDECACIF